MPYASGHLIGCWGLAKLYEKAKGYAFSHLEWGLLLFGSILPDADLLIDWTFGTQLHRGPTHSLLFAIAVGLIVCGATAMLKHGQRSKQCKPMAYGFAIAFGILTHILLDMTLGKPGIRLLWPSGLGVWFFGMAPYPPHSFFSENLSRLLRFAIVDMALGVLWLGYFWMRKRIRF